MFDIGFWELLVLAALGLMILGPERLPRVIGQLGRWLRKARRTASQLRWQIEHELDLTERREAEHKRRQAAPPAAPRERAADADGSGDSHGDAAAAAHSTADPASDPAPDTAPDLGADTSADTGRPPQASGAAEVDAPARMPERETAMTDEDHDPKTSTRP